MVSHRLGIEILTAGPAILAPIGAEKEVVLIEAHRVDIAVGRWVEVR
jgi:hypothetical protein